MKVPNIFIIIIYLSFIKIKPSYSIINISFHKEVENLSGNNPSEIFQKLKDNILLAEINLGSPSQKIGLKMELAEYASYIGGQSSLCQQKFMEKNSESYKKLEESKAIRASSLNEGIFSSDYFYFNEDKKQLNFLLGIDTDKCKGGGIFGLNYQDTDNKIYDDYNFINNIKKSDIIKDYYFSIQYKDNNSGNLIIGDILNSHTNDYNKKYFKDMYITEFTGALTWNINLESVFSASKDDLDNKKIVGEKVYGYFKIELGIILGTDRYKQYIYSDFFSEKIEKKLCFEEKSTFYINYYCKEEVDITKFKNLFFYVKDLDYSFELDYNDLFYKNDDGNYYFLIYFNSMTDEGEDFYDYFWTFGEPFFKKYNLILNQDTKRIGFYTKNENENIKSQSYWQRNKGYIILIIILVIAFSGLGFMIFLYLKVLPKRKIKAFELDDEFDYTRENNKIIN